MHGQPPDWSGLIVVRREDHFDFLRAKTVVKSRLARPALRRRRLPTRQRDLRSVKPLTEDLTAQSGVESVRHVESVEREQLNRWEMSKVARPSQSKGASAPIHQLSFVRFHFSDKLSVVQQFVYPSALT